MCSDLDYCLTPDGKVFECSTERMEATTSLIYTFNRLLAY